MRIANMRTGLYNIFMNSLSILRKTDLSYPHWVKLRMFTLCSAHELLNVGIIQTRVNLKTIFERLLGYEIFAVKKLNSTRSL